MGRTYVEGTVSGRSTTRLYSFLVDTGAAVMGLPLEEIQALELEAIPNGRGGYRTATGITELDCYLIRGEIRGRGFGTMVVPMPIPVVGYEMLQTMRLKVNPVTEELEDVPDDEIGPPYLLSFW